VWSEVIKRQVERDRKEIYVVNMDFFVNEKEKTGNGDNLWRYVMQGCLDVNP
jgi:hypothetical protein